VDRISRPDKFSSSAKKDFFNNIRQRTPAASKDANEREPIFAFAADENTAA
jgi:hypothetical protein